MKEIKNVYFETSTSAVYDSRGIKWKCGLYSIANRLAQFIILCLCLMLQSVSVNGANTAILTTIERLFYMSSVESALFLVFYDVSNIIASPIVGYFGDRKHQPTIIALSMLGLGLGSFITTIPQFIIFGQQALTTGMANVSAQSTFNATNNLVCYPSRITNGLTLCQTGSDSSLNNLKYILYFANVINGVSSVALYTISISYIENLFEKEKAPMYQGIYFSAGIVGVGVGMLGTGALLNINTSLRPNQKASASTTDVNFIGAWWILYLFSAVISWILAFLVARFAIVKSTATSEITIENIERSGFKFHLKEFKLNLMSIFKNKIYMVICICITIETFIQRGYSSYLTKFVEYQYRLPSSLASILTGTIGFLSLLGGVLVGSILTKKFKWSIRECCVFIIVIKFFSSFLFFGFMIYCPQEQFIHDLNVHPFNSSVNCNCNPNTYEPVCYETKYLFQTPCHAGCLYKSNANTYTHCYALNSIENTSGVNDSASDDYLSLKTCPRPAVQCTRNLILTGIVGFSVMFFSSMGIIPLLKIILDSIQNENLSFALGLRSLFTKLFGHIPAPLVFASIIDKSCLLWNYSCSGSRTCRLYENKAFSFGLSIIGLSFRLASTVFALITFYFVRKELTRRRKAATNVQMTNGYENKSFEIY